MWKAGPLKTVNCCRICGQAARRGDRGAGPAATRLEALIGRMISGPSTGEPWISELQIDVGAKVPGGACH